MEKKILDVTCGARTMWFNKHHPAAVYCDKRREEYHHLWKNAGNCSLNIDPDVLCDFTDLPFPDNSFQLVVFDPPHLTGAKETAWLVKKYGKLDDTWPHMLHDGFLECMRVLKPDGVLIFKWSEYDIPAAEVWKAIGQKPLFGHKSGKKSRTFWACFMKLEEAAQEWISVKDRLPEEKVNCIVYYRHAYCDNDDYWAIGMCFYDGEKFQMDSLYKVTHWQYLPRPPKGE